MANTVYVNDGGGSGNSARTGNTGLVYDPKTGKWVHATVNSTGGELPQSPDSSNNEVPTPDSSNDSESQNDAEREFIEVEYNTLSGEMSVTTTPKSIRVKVNDTVKVEGIGAYLSGLYFVSEIKRSISSSDGYTHTFTLIKNGFGSSLKKAIITDDTRKTSVNVSAPEVKVGDTVQIVGDDAVYSNASDGVKVPNWVKQKTLTVKQISGDGTRVLLMPITSWTYMKYIQKV